MGLKLSSTVVVAAASVSSQLDQGGIETRLKPPGSQTSIASQLDQGGIETKNMEALRAIIAPRNWIRVGLKHEGSLDDVGTGDLAIGSGWD